MSDFGLTAAGFLKKRYEDIEAEIQTSLRSVDPELNLAPDSVASKLIAAFALPLSEVWEAMQAVYSSQLPDAAEGVNLDGVVSLVGVTRLAATRSTVQAVAAGDPGTVLPIGRVASVVDSGERFQSTEAVTIPAGFTGLVYFRARVASPSVSQTYGFQILSPSITSVTFSSGPVPTPETVAASFVFQVNANPIASALLTPFSQPNGRFGFLVDDLDVPVTIVLTTAPDTATIEARGVAMPMEAENTGAIAAAMNQLAVIETPVSGWLEVFNPADAIVGQNLETDAALRLRREQSLQASGSGTVEAIRARLLQDVEGVTAALVIENDTDLTDSATPVGRPPHSFEAVVLGGDDTEIAQRLWEVKPASIKPVSSQNAGPYKVSENILDTMGISHLIEYSRPVQLAIYARVTVMLHPEELALVPVDYVDSIKAAVVAFGDVLQIGVDILPGRIERAVFDSVAGLYAATVEVSLSSIAGVIQKTRTLPLAIGNVSIVDFDLTRVSVVTVTVIADTDY